MADTGLTKNQILSELSRSPHGKLTEYVEVGRKAANLDAGFFAHLIAWDRTKGQIRDAKVALPVVSLSVLDFPADLAENSLAHLGLLGPRELLRAYRFALELRLPGRMRSVRRVVESYLRERETNTMKFERIAVMHRHTLKELYALTHLDMPAWVRGLLFLGDRREGSVADAVAKLKDMSPTEAAGTIIERKIPFLVAMGALGKKAHEPDLVLALINRMSPTELVTNTKLLQKLGVKTNSALRGAYEQAMEKASTSKANVLKTTRAAEAIEDDDLKEKLRGMQERQIQALSGVDGNWLVLADKSGSMTHSIDKAREVAATLAKMVKGNVWLVFFDTSPMTVDVTGLALDHIKMATRHITANGGTSIGCGLKRMLDEKVEIDGIAIVSDGAEHSPPFFHDTLKQYNAWSGKDVPVYLYDVAGEPNSLSGTMQRAGVDMQVFDLRNQNVDFYSLPNLVQTMRTNRYSLIDEVMAAPLLTLADVFKISRKEVEAHA